MENANPILEVRRNREKLLEKYNSIDGLHQHMDSERQTLENQGWTFVSAEEVLAKKQNFQKAMA